MAANRVRIERGLYQDGHVYYACATPPGSRSAAWKSLGTVGRMEARRLRDEFVAEVRRGTSTATRTTRSMTFARAADAWLAAQRSLVDVGELAPRTFDGYELSVRRHLKPWFASIAIQHLTADSLVAWHVDQRSSGAAAWSIKGRWTALRGILGYALRKGWIATNPADALTSRERPKPGASRKRFLTEAEMRLLVDTARGRDRLLVGVLLFAGLRISEALGLAWEDVDLGSGHLRLRYQLARNGKRVRLKTVGSSRDVVLMDSLAAQLRRHRLASRHSGDSDPIFATFAGTHVSARNAGRALGHIMRNTSLTGVTPHVLRHTYASILISQGRDPVFVADQLGHSDPAITLRVYAHLFRAAAQEQAARNDLEAGFGGLLR
jgi:integrase